MNDSIKLDTINALEKWLNKSGINTKGWEVQAKKTLVNLWDEYKSGDCILKDGPLRHITIVILIIIRGNNILFETKQKFVNGIYRIRNKPPREKVKPNETIIEATKRCLKQELQLLELDYQILNISNTPKIYKRESDSYPGLNTEYTEYFADISTLKLPNISFLTKEIGDAYDPVEEHYWEWKLRIVDYA